jgi:tRNA(Ile)-lysidine synthase
MRYLVAVSGGIDSVVLLDKLATEKKHELIVAHFDHGIRKDSASDARFVQGLAAQYNLPFVTAREELGEQASEELARTRRYGFLRQAASAAHAKLVTAHHSDDIVETIAINLIRGTGWRGVAVLGRADIYRPLLTLTKADIRAYALNRRLEWVEDSTNASMQYLRNRVRRALARSLSLDAGYVVRALWRQQEIVKVNIDTETATFVHVGGEYSRYFFTQLDLPTACELLRAVIVARGGASPMRPQLERALLAIKTVRANTQCDVSGSVQLRFTIRTFIVQTP